MQIAGNIVALTKNSHIYLKWGWGKWMWMVPGATMSHANVSTYISDIHKSTRRQ